jgi:hypothetical protein
VKTAAARLGRLADHEQNVSPAKRREPRVCGALGVRSYRAGLLAVAVAVAVAVAIATGVAVTGVVYAVALAFPVLLA